MIRRRITLLVANIPLLQLLLLLPLVSLGLFSPHPPDPPTPTILETQVLHDHWRRLIRRRVQFSNQSNTTTTTATVVDFELVGQRDPDQAVLIFCWFRSNHTVTLVREYMPSQEDYGYGLAAGMVDNSDNGDQLAAAKRELAEECYLEGGTWLQLTPSTETAGVVVDKYCTTRMTVFLVIDPVPLEHHQRASILRDDAEEGMQSLNLSMQQFQDECLPNMTIVGAWASMLAIQKISRILKDDNKT